MVGRRSVRGVESIEGESEYDRAIAANKAANKALLEKVMADMAGNGVPLPRTARSKSAADIPKRKRQSIAPTEPSRKSARISQKVVQLQELDSDVDVDVKRVPRMKRTSKTEVKNNDDGDGTDDGDGDEDEVRPKVNARIFGPIPGIAIGAHWEFRAECGKAGVHPPTVAGIYGGSETGAYSVAVNSGYPEDIDLGDAFTYTGSGGRELRKGNKRVAPQSKDQVLSRGNAALDKSFQTGNPVRVIRGNKAPMGPHKKGYRYDGLYKVVRSYTAMNSDEKYKVYKFDFERLPGQEPVDYTEKARQQAREEAEIEAAAQAFEAVAEDTVEDVAGY